MEPLDYLFGLEQFGIKFGLENIRTLVGALGHPDRAFRSIHIAGTNGKGSVTAMVDAGLRAAGHRSARFTSPHLIDLTERFAIDDRPVSGGALVAAIADLRTRVEALIASGALRAQPTFFEATTALALELFRRAGVDTAVIEVGLGGRLDSTNVITPVVTAITSIAFDHEAYLGHTLAAIATEKAGIIKPAVPVVVGRVPAEAETAIDAVARARGALVVRAWDGVIVEPLPRTPGAATRVRLRTPARDYGDVTLSLRGAHQIGNAVVAVRLLELLDQRGLAVPSAAVVGGLGSVTWPGRLDHRRLSGGREMLLDAAHNPDGAAMLAGYIAETFEDKPPLVFAAMRDKDAARMFEALLPSVGALIVTRASTARSAEPETLAQHAAAVAPGLRVIVEPDRAAALAAAWTMAPRIVVAGSIFLLGDVLKETDGS
ncbi:MAG: folylpolyglutamate synthase/dihydrofolate synthase family protein [Acidobacteriota bacterium]